MRSQAPRPKRRGPEPSTHGNQLRVVLAPARLSGRRKTPLLAAEPLSLGRRRPGEGSARPTEFWLCEEGAGLGKAGRGEQVRQEAKGRAQGWSWLGGSWSGGARAASSSVCYWDLCREGNHLLCWLEPVPAKPWHTCA